MALKVGELFALLRLEDKDFKSGLNSAGKSFSNVGGQILGLAAKIGAAVGFYELGKSALSLAGNLEQSKIAFTTMLGSAEKADAFLKQLADFAAKTPFDLKGLQDSSRKLLAFGFDSQKIIPMMTAIGRSLGSVDFTTIICLN
jgi:phage tail tape-measure protein